MHKILIIAIVVIVLVMAVTGVGYVDAINNLTGIVANVGNALNSINGVSGILSDRLTPTVPIIDGVFGSYHDTSNNTYIDIANYIRETYTPNYDKDERFNSVYPTYRIKVSPKIYSLDVSYVAFKDINDFESNYPYDTYDSYKGFTNICYIENALKFDLTVFFPETNVEWTYNIYIGKPLFNDKIVYNAPDLPYVIIVNMVGTTKAYISTRYNNVSEFKYIELYEQKLNAAHEISLTGYTKDWLGNITYHDIMDRGVYALNINESTKEVKENFELFYEME